MMKHVFKAIPIAEKIFWVGAIDWAVRDFHGYSTNRGTTYNAYLILDDSITLIDTVRHNYMDEMMDRIASVTDPKNIKTIISNHAEMDHSGSLPEVLNTVNPDTLIASVKGAAALRDHFHFEFPIHEVKSGDSISTGSFTIQFLETAMLHWPDSMVSYIPQLRLLFSQDAFGMHLAGSERFADEVKEETLLTEAKKYYANILWPYSGLILKLFERVKSAGLQFDVIAPDHGPVWRKPDKPILDWYLNWAKGTKANKTIIVYDTMWHSTELMARAIGDGLKSVESPYRILSLAGTHRSDVVTELLDARAIIVGSPTLNNQMFPVMADLMTYLKGLKPKFAAGAVFGSYGWSGESIEQLRDSLTAMKINVIGQVKTKYVPDKNALQECFDLGVTMGTHLKGEVS